MNGDSVDSRADRQIGDGDVTGLDRESAVDRHQHYGFAVSGLASDGDAAGRDLSVMEGADIHVTVSGAAAATAELYAAGAAMPTRSVYDERGIGSASQDPQVRLTYT